MAAKATVTELQAEGFEASSFGVDQASWDAYLQSLLDEQSLIVTERVGTATYGSVDPLIVNRIKRAERFLAASELWFRRMNQVESDVSLNGEDIKSQGFIRYKTNHESYARKASAEIAALPNATATPSEISSAPAFGAVTSSHFEASQ